MLTLTIIISGKPLNVLLQVPGQVIIFQLHYVLLRTVNNINFCIYREGDKSIINIHDERVIVMVDSTGVDSSVMQDDCMNIGGSESQEYFLEKLPRN